MDSTNSFKIAMLIKEIYSSTVNILSDGLKNSGLTHQQIMIMKLIAHKNEVTISELCNEMSLAKGTVSGIVQRLERDGYVEKIKYEKDKRNTYIKFSTKGIAFAHEFKDHINESFDKVFENFSSEELEHIKDTLINLNSKIKKE